MPIGPVSRAFLLIPFEQTVVQMPPLFQGFINGDSQSMPSFTAFTTLFLGKPLCAAGCHRSAVNEVYAKRLERDVVIAKVR